MKHKFIQILIANLFIIQMFSGCKKDFLDAKPSSQILQPTSLADFQGLLSNETTINNSPGLGLLAADDYSYSSYASWQATQTATERNSYIWAKDLYQGEVAGGDWSWPYTSIFYANSVLAGLNNIQVTSLNSSQWNYTKGWALFIRAFAYYDLVRTFSPAYDASTANTDLGVPIRLNPSVDELLPRSTVQQTYNRILTDVNQATQLLDAVFQTANRNKPSKAVAYALAARVLLNMRNYPNAELKADSCLQLYNKLIDYNTVSQTATTPFSTINDELLYTKSATNAYATSYATNSGLTQISQDLLNLYSTNDLRKAIFFVKEADGTYDMKRSYRGSGLFPFTGLAMDEVYLIKAECAARRNDVPTAMSYLNQLLVKRYVTNNFTPLTATSGTDALNQILVERRKELVWRTLRWDDLKRLNKEGANITLTRMLNGQIYTIAPNSPLYVFPIPDNEIQLSGIQQNQR